MKQLCISQNYFPYHRQGKLRKFFACMFLFLLFLSGLFEQRALCHASSHSFISSQPNFFYFNPDSSQTNLGRLKREMDAFLKEASLDFTFQPFARQRDFENQIREMHPAFVLLPYWYYQIHGSELKLEPLLSPVRNGMITYTKMLMVRKDSSLDVESLRKKFGRPFCLGSRPGGCGSGVPYKHGAVRSDKS